MSISCSGTGALVILRRTERMRRTTHLLAHISGGSLVKLDAAKDNQSYREEQSGEAKWVAVRNKYFVAALIPSDRTGGLLH